MEELAFVFLADDVTLRHLVDRALQHVQDTGRAWYELHVLIRDEQGYRAARLSTLSAELAGREWSLDTPLTDLDLTPAAAVAADQVGPDQRRQVREPWIAALQDGQPVALYPGRTMRGSAAPDDSTWWRLVGRRMAELGREPSWPDPLPERFQLEPVLVVEREKRLFELAQALEAASEPKPVLVLPGAAPGTWAVYPAQDLVAYIGARYPDASPRSMVGALVDPAAASLPVLERAQTPWELVVALAGDRSVRYLVTRAGQPIAVLRRERLQRGSTSTSTCQPVSKGLTPEPEQATGWARFLQPAAEEEYGGRVVNTWFTGADPDALPISPRRALAANRIYRLGVTIGARDPRGNVRGDQPAIPAGLVAYLVGQGQPLTLRLESEVFFLLDHEQNLYLPAGGTSEVIYFRLATPVQTGLSSLRLGVYFENNLVQSYTVSVQVAPTEGDMPTGVGDGWWSACDYTLSADLTNLNDLSPRRVCIWVGEGREQVPRGGMVGLEVGRPLHIDPALLSAALVRYRELLRQACFKDPESEKPRYRYDDDHRPLDEDTFRQAMLDLAELGQQLYIRLLGDRDGVSVTRQMREQERMHGAPLVVQIARLTLDTVFPWAVLYDRPLRYHPNRNQVCDQFLANPDCLSGCADEDENVICPYGFWGFRYIIEQPLRPPGRLASIATRLPAAGRPRMALVFGGGLGLADRHRQQVAEILEGQADPAIYTDTDAVLCELSQSPEVVYFYCHGGSAPYRQWLAIGPQDPLMVSYLRNDLYDAWQDGAPLVVLNGCRTAEYSPATLLSFVHRFGELDAAGVIGTEIPIHEYLGDMFGQFLLGRLLEGQPIGRILYDLRRELLGKKNVMGLAYVPYCYADLCLDKQASRVPR